MLAKMINKFSSTLQEIKTLSLQNRLVVKYTTIETHLRHTCKIQVNALRKCFKMKVT